VRECACTAERIQRYRDKLSGPLLDRIDLQVPVLPLQASLLDSRELLESSISVQERVLAAQEFRMERESAGGTDRAHLGSQHPSSLALRSALGDGAKRLLAQAVARGVIGGRGYARTLNVARTLADLDSSPSIDERHAAEALSLRVGP
jgi:magnesium chelatase family protein